MENNDFKNWKEIFLKSGLPLENSVKNILLDLGMRFVDEYNFLRKNIDGNINNFSVDFSFGKRVNLPYETKEKGKDYFYVCYFVECKYCTPNTNWVFMPYQRGDVDGYSIAIDAYCKKYCLNEEYFEEIFNYKNVSKGVSLRTKCADFTQIKEAYHQLAYAYINYLFDSLNYKKDSIEFIIPIIVTTANLWVIKDNCNLENIEYAKDFNEICTQHDVVQYFQRPDELMKNFYMNKFYSLDDELRQDLCAMMMHNYSGMNPLVGIDAESCYSPDVFFVINYKAFKKIFKQIDDFLINSDIVKFRKKNC